MTIEKLEQDFVRSQTTFQIKVFCFFLDDIRYVEGLWLV
jgi:hypothetical protein